MSISQLQLDQQPLEIQTLAEQFRIIQEELVNRTPGLPTALVTIHKMLNEHEELTNILDDDDIELLHKSHEAYKQVILFQKEIDKLGKGKKKKLSDQDLSNL